MVFYDAEVAMILAVFLAVDAAQKHDNRRVPDLRPQRKVLGHHSTVFSNANDENARLKHENHHKKLKNVRNCESWARSAGASSQGGVWASVLLPEPSRSGDPRPRLCTEASRRSGN